MRDFLSVISLAALAAALPADTKHTAELDTREDINITSFTVITTEQGEVMSVSFLLTGDNATDIQCAAQGLDFPSPVYTCGDTKYRFALWTGKTQTYALRLYHELGIGVGFYGVGDIFTYCHAGGLQRMFCTQQFPVSIVIDSEPDVEDGTGED